MRLADKRTRISLTPSFVIMQQPQCAASKTRIPHIHTYWTIKIVLCGKWIAIQGGHVILSVMKGVPFVRRAAVCERRCPWRCPGGESRAKGDGSAKEGSWPLGAGVGALGERWRVWSRCGLPAEWPSRLTAGQPARACTTAHARPLPRAHYPGCVSPPVPTPTYQTY